MQEDTSKPVSHRLEEFVTASRKLENALSHEKKRAAMLQKQLKHNHERYTRILEKERQTSTNLKIKNSQIEDQLKRSNNEGHDQLNLRDREIKKVTTELKHYKKTWEVMKSREEIMSQLTQQNKELAVKLSRSGARSRLIEDTLRREREQFQNLTEEFRTFVKENQKVINDLKIHSVKQATDIRDLRVSQQNNRKTDKNYQSEIQILSTVFENKHNEILSQFMQIKKCAEDSTKQINDLKSEIAKNQPELDKIHHLIETTAARIDRDETIDREERPINVDVASSEFEDFAAFERRLKAETNSPRSNNKRSITTDPITPNAIKDKMQSFRRTLNQQKEQIDLLLGEVEEFSDPRVDF